MGELVQLSGGDAIKMQEIMAQAQKDPQAFKNKLSPKSQKAIEEMARQIPVQGASSP
jgi:hypothetical protein